MAAKPAWEAMPWQDRARIFAKAAALLAGPMRQQANAATMLGQSKSPMQAEIDSACELIDFWNFNIHFMGQIYAQQPSSGKGFLDWMEHRALEGFVLAITPFNFSSIGGNLPTAPAMMGNVVLWKPASSAVLSAQVIMKVLQAAGLPKGVINMIPCSGREMGSVVLSNKHLAGIHFTGSTGTFNSIWRTIGEHLDIYHVYPRLVGETGGKDFIFAHPDCDQDALLAAAVRGAFEYQGQKCSAASRMYVPVSVWKTLGGRLGEAVKGLNMGDVCEDFRCFLGAVIDEAAFKSITSYIDYAKNSTDAKILVGGSYDKSKGWFIQPTVIVTTNPRFKTMEEEIFGPVLTVFVYPDDQLEETLTLCDTTSNYALTGAIFCNDRATIVRLTDRLRHAAGNFYINDKPTGAVVGMQPFGGARKSGTNDKAGSMLNLLRWASPRTIKENFLPPVAVDYPHMSER